MGFVSTTSSSSLIFDIVPPVRGRSQSSAGGRASRPDVRSTVQAQRMLRVTALTTAAIGAGVGALVATRRLAAGKIAGFDLSKNCRSELVIGAIIWPVTAWF